MSSDDAVRDWSWWSTPHWEEYCGAYGSPPGRPVHGDSYVVDLSLEPWKHLSKGHRSAIKIQMATQHVRTVTDVRAFHRGHLEAAGRETRTQTTWDLMQDWIDCRWAVCVTNGVGGWAYVICDPPGAYYASGAGRDCHYLQYKVICGLKDAGFDWYELGEGHTSGITTFKKGFATGVVEPREKVRF